MDPLDRKIGLISKDEVPLLLGRRELNGFSPIIPLLIWFDPWKQISPVLGWRAGVKPPVLDSTGSRETEQQRQEVNVRQHLPGVPGMH